jgi:hypothetical protein
MDEGNFFSSVKVRNNGDEFYCEVINVYGPVKVEVYLEDYRLLIDRIVKCLQQIFWKEEIFIFR